jgi:opacity protein-like surface antigen
MNRHIVVLLLMIASLTSKSQVRLGITGGIDYNIYSINTHYMENWHYEGNGGYTAGIMGQYDFKDWIGLRMELNWAQKNYRLYGTGDYLEYTNIETYNNYIQLPVMASVSAGNKRWRGFVILGGYGAWWLNKKQIGAIACLSFDEKVPIALLNKYTSFSDERDNRYDFGLVGGLGIEWQFLQEWGCQVEGRCYYSMTSTQKDYMRIKDPKYNTTYSLQLTVWKRF